MQINNDLTETQKLEVLTELKSINGITAVNGWQSIMPDNHNDWLGQRDDSFDEFIVMGDKKNRFSKAIFENYTTELTTNRDAWCYNSSKVNLSENVEGSIEFYNALLEGGENISEPKAELQKISWSRALKKDFSLKKPKLFSKNYVIASSYRPFTKQWVYFDRGFNEYIYQIPKLFPNSASDNRVIHISGTGARSGFSALMAGSLIDIQHIDNGQCFPLKLYEENSASVDNDLFASQDTQAGYTVKYGLTDGGLAHFRAAYPNETITKEDIFYYIYGLLHSEDYRTRYADNLSKQLPRIPCVKKAKDFWVFAESGRKLGGLHVEYESAKRYPVTIEGNPKTDKDYYVTKMKFGKAGKEKDKTTVIYNDYITIKDIPLEAYNYIVNGKAALDWVMDRQCVKTDKTSGIVNDANLYATETVGDAKYPLELFQRVITVSLETMKIVRSLPPLDID